MISGIAVAVFPLEIRSLRDEPCLEKLERYLRAAGTDSSARRAISWSR